MVRRYFSPEDTNQETAILYGSRRIPYSDIDLFFQKKPSGDVYKKSEAAAVKQAVKNILLTNLTEKPFNPAFGGDLSNLLFELADDESDDILRLAITTAIENWEPRARVTALNVNISPDDNSARVRVTFNILNLEEEVTLETTVIRLR